ncbi:MAG TPA: hypothetical protein VIW07_18115 [Candidatus Udaeobacter sp.]|jgi:hypothetical protein
MNEHGFIMFNRSPDVDELLKDPLAFALLAQIARRARWRNIYGADGLEIGEALIGDYKSIGMTRAEYRTRIARLEKGQQITVRTTNKGTIAKLISHKVFDINDEGFNRQDSQQLNQPATNGSPSDNHRTTNGSPLTNKDKKATTKERNKGTARMFISEAKDRITAIDEEIVQIESSSTNWLPTSEGVHRTSDLLKPDAMTRIATLKQSKLEAEKVLKGV